MAPEASWQASSAETLGGSDVSLSGTHMDQQTVESLLRRLVERVEESERRYGEALDELHARLDRLSKTTDAAPATDSSEETETLERLRSQLSSLAKRLDHPDEMEPGFDGLAKLGRAWSEARDLSAGLAEEQSLFASPLLPVPASFSETAPFSFAMPGETPSYSTPSFELPPFGNEHLDLDKRLIDMAQRLDHSIGEAMPAAAIETLNTRMEEIARRFEAALEHSPKLENLQHLERQITEIGQQLGGVERQVARIAIIEGQLHRLIERLEDGPAQMEHLASKAANEAVRLVSETGLGQPSAAERLDTIHRDIVAMNERSRATDDRLVDTLAAMHESLRDLVHQVDRGRQPSPTPPRAQPQPHWEPAPSYAEAPNEKAITRGATEDVRAGYRSLRSLLGATAQDFEDIEPAPAFGRAKRGPLAEEAVDLDESEPSRPGALSVPEAPLGSRDDLVAAARRAAQSAAARAKERGALGPRRARLTDEASTEAGMDLPERRKRSILMIVAVLLLLVSAALLYSRLPSKPEVETDPPATEQSAPAPAAEAIPAPAAEASPALQAAPVPEAAPPLAIEAAPETTIEDAPAPDLSPAPEAAPAPEAGPEAPHATTPSAESGDEELPPPVRVSEAPIIVAAAGNATLTGGVTEIAKSSAAPAAQAEAEVTVKPQLASLRSDGAALPAGISVTVAEAPASVRSTLPMPGAELGPLALRQAAANGDARAQYAVALRYTQGQGSARALAPNWTEAARWFSLAASAGLAPAQYRLAVLYERGDGVAKDFGRAKSWYASAAERGNVKAMHNLAVAASRESSNADFALAAKWYAEAASYGLAASQFNLGVLAEHGLGIQKSLAEAYKWFSLAAASRDSEAIKRRDVIKPALPAAALAEAEQAVKVWTAKPAIAEANEVPEQDSWRAEVAAPNKGPGRARPGDAG